MEVRARVCALTPPPGTADGCRLPDDAMDWTRQRRANRLSQIGVRAGRPGAV